MEEALKLLVANEMAIVTATVDSTTLLIRSLVRAKVLTPEQAAAALLEISDHIIKLSEDPKLPDQVQVLKIISDRYQENAEALKNHP